MSLEQMQTQQPQTQPAQQLQRLQQAKIEIENILSKESLTSQKFKEVYQIKLQVDDEINLIQQQQQSQGKQQQGRQQLPQQPQQGMINSLMQTQKPVRQSMSIPTSAPIQPPQDIGMSRLPNTGFVNQVLQQLNQNGIMQGM